MRPASSTVALAAIVVALAAPAVADGSSSSYGLVIRQATVNPDRTVSLEWMLEDSDVSNLSISVDGTIVKRWPDGNRDTGFTTQPLVGGRHRIKIEVLETFLTNTNYGPTDCDVSPRDDFQWVCEWRWSKSLFVSVPERAASAGGCVVPHVVGLRLPDARAQLTKANCSLGSVARVDSSRTRGTVLRQSSEWRSRLPKSALVSLVVSNGKPPTA